MISSFTHDTVSGGILADLVSYNDVYIAAGITVGSSTTTAVHGQGGNHQVTLLGDLFGVGSAILFDGLSSVDNSVLIGKNASVTASDDVSKFGIGIHVSSTRSSIDNRGSIFGTDQGIVFDSVNQSVTGSSVIVNRGDIESIGIGIKNSSHETLEIRNTGLIATYGRYAIEGSDFVDKVINKGHIEGNIDLGGGNDIYDGRGGSVDGIGVSLNSVVYGDNGNDLLRGGAYEDWLDGGYGKDTMIGGAGDDVFQFTTSVIGSSNADKILDFNIVHDTIALDDQIFTSLGSTINPYVFSSKPSAAAEHAAVVSDRKIVYNYDTGALYYDDDGKGSHSRVLFATLSPGLKLTSDDFLLI